MDNPKFEIIPFYILNRIFPNDTMWVSAGSDIYGYSFSNSIYIEIEDGMCHDESCDYIVRVFKSTINLTNQCPFHWEFGQDRKPLMSFANFNQCIMDEVICFTNDDDIKKYHLKFKYIYNNGGN